MICQELSSRFNSTQDKELASQLFRHHMRRDEPMSALGLLSHLDASTLASLPGLALCTLARFAYLGALKAEAAIIHRTIKVKLDTDPGPEQAFLIDVYLASAITGLDIVEAWPAIDGLLKAANGRLRARTLSRQCVLAIITGAKWHLFDHSGVDRFPGSYRYSATSACCIAARRPRQRSVYVGLSQASGWRRLTPWQPWSGAFSYVYEDPSTEQERRNNALCVDVWTKRHDVQPYRDVIKIKQLRRRI